MDEIFDFTNRRRLTLKRGKERVVANRHPWIFAGAVGSESGPADAAIGDLVDGSGARLASGFYSSQSEIRLRALTFGQEELTADVIAGRIDAAIARRRPLLDANTNAARLINAEGDGLSGLVVDLYNDVVVAEVANAGIERIKTIVLDAIHRNAKPRLIYLSNDLPARRIEQLPTETQSIGTRFWSSRGTIRARRPTRSPASSSGTPRSTERSRFGTPAPPETIPISGRSGA